MIVNNVCNHLIQICGKRNIIETMPISQKINVSDLRYIPLSADTFQRSSFLDINNFSPNVIDRTTGQKIKIALQKFEKKGQKIFYLRDKYGERLGYEVVSLPGNYIGTLPSRNDYIHKALEVEFLETKNNGCKASNYKGLGTELLKAAVLESKNLGYGGRIFLWACDVKPPTPFYYKRGLRFFEDYKNKAMASYLANKAGSNSQLKESIKRGLMYLPEENIDKLLNNY